MANKDICLEDVFKKLSAHHKVINKTKVKKAYHFASKQHLHQKRLSGENYIMHPLRVAHTVASWGFDGDMVCAALLHDVVEDCKVSFEDIRKLFGSSVSNLVEALTDFPEDIKGGKKLSKKKLFLKSLNQ